MFESRDAVNNQTAGTTDNTRSIFTSIAQDAWRPYPKPDFQAMSEKTNPIAEIGPKAVGAVGDKGHGHGCALPSFDLSKELRDRKTVDTDSTGNKSVCATPDFKSPGNPQSRLDSKSQNGPDAEIADGVSPEDMVPGRLSAEVMLDLFIKSDDPEQQKLDDKLNAAFLSGNLNLFADVLKTVADDPLELRKAIARLNQRMEKLEGKNSDEDINVTYVPNGDVIIYEERQGKTQAVNLDPRNGESKSIYSVTLKDGHTMFNPEYKFDTNPAELFGSLVRNGISAFELPKGR